MIDTGCAHCASELLNALEIESLKYIINTHSHEDHIGTNGLLQARKKELEIFAHPLALPILADPKGNQPLQFYRRLMWGDPKPSNAKQVIDGTILTTKNHNFRVIYTAGHSPDHLCLYEPEKQWLFTGDLFVGGRDRALRANYDIWLTIKSLKKISLLPIKMLFPGSARVRQNPKDELKWKVSYLEELGEKVLNLHNQGMNVKSIVRTLFKRAMFIEFLTFGHFSRRRLVLSYLGIIDTQ
jgi:glyoxylase-like metal-dependent hydrolase (beta-lactamase superfamily II)